MLEWKKNKGKSTNFHKSYFFQLIHCSWKKLWSISSLIFGVKFYQDGKELFLFFKFELPRIYPGPIVPDVTKRTHSFTYSSMWDVFGIILPNFGF